MDTTSFKSCNITGTTPICHFYYLGIHGVYANRLLVLFLPNGERIGERQVYNPKSVEDFFRRTVRAFIAPIYPLAEDLTNHFLTLMKWNEYCISIAPTFQYAATMTIKVMMDDTEMYTVTAEHFPDAELLIELLMPFFQRRPTYAFDFRVFE